MSDLNHIYSNVALNLTLETMFGFSAQSYNHPY